jgi:hypothetical protein
VWTIQHQSRLRGKPHPPTPTTARKGEQAQPSLARLGRTGAVATDAQAGLVGAGLEYQGDQGCSYV